MFFIYLFNNNFSFLSLDGNKNKRQGKMKRKLAVVKWIFFQAPVVQKLDNAIHRLNHYPVDKY